MSTATYIIHTTLMSVRTKALAAAAAALMLIAGIAIVGDSFSRDTADKTTQVEASAYRSVTGKLYPGSTAWSQPVPSDAATDAASKRWVDYIIERQSQRSKDGPFLAIRRYAVPVWVGSSKDPVMKITACRSYPCRNVAGTRLRVPRGAKADLGTDGHMVLVDQRREIAYDLFKAQKNGNTWSGAGGGRTRYRTSRSATGRRSGATAAHSALLAGLIRPQEIRRGRIDHALQATIPGIGSGEPRCPAVANVPTTDDPDAPPEGTRFQLSPSVNVGELEVPRIVRVIARALQRYGMIVVDNGGQIAFRGENPIGKKPDPWAALGYDNASSISLAGLPLDELRVIEQKTC